MGEPGPISLPYLFPGDGVFSICICRCVGSEDPFDQAEDLLDHLEPLPVDSLDDGNEVVQVDIDIFCGSGALILWKGVSSWYQLGSQACLYQPPLWPRLPAPADACFPHPAG